MLVKMTGILAVSAAFMPAPAIASPAAASPAVAFPAAASPAAASPAAVFLAIAADPGDPTVLADGVIDLTAASQGGDDAEFRELLASWEALEEGGTISTSGDVIPPASARAAVSVPQIMPVNDARLSSGYGVRNHPVLRRRAHHNGVDLAAPTGTPVYATADGYVEKAQRFGSYGNYVQIEHGGDIETRYAHLSSYTVRPGDTVRMGDLIGHVGSTGRSTGPHLHYEVRVSGDAVNPIPYMTANLDYDYGANAARGGPEDQ